MMLKGFIFVMIMLNSSTFVSGNTQRNHLQFLLGCRAEIPCQHKKSDSNAFKWFYQKEEHINKIQILFEDKTGVVHRSKFHRAARVTQDRALVIDNFTEDDQGLYWCENCYNDNCKSEQSTVIRVIKEILTETCETVCVTAGSTFTYSRSGKFTDYKWTFEASNTVAPNNSAGPETNVTFNKSVQIVNVKREDGGKYSCWVTTCDRRWQKIYTINLCVITGNCKKSTVHQSGNSSASCSGICDMEFSYVNPNVTTNEVTSTGTTPVGVNQYGSKQMFNAYNAVTSSGTLSNTSVKTAGINTQRRSLIPVIYVTSAALTCLILLALFIFYFRPRLRADVSNSPTGSDIDGIVEEESSVVYSSVVFRTPAKTTNNHMNDSDCVYSEIKV